MKLVLNGEDRTVEAATVAELVEWLGVGPAGVAVAVNEEVVARSTWSAICLQEGARVEILGAMQGG